MGYLVGAIVEYIFSVWVSAFIAFMILWCIGLFLFELSLTKNTKRNLRSIEANAKIKANQTKATAQIGGYIRLHSSEKQLSI